MLDRSAALQFWPFAEQGVIYLNHGSFGAVPKPVHAAQQALQQQLYANPMDFLTGPHTELMSANRLHIAALTQADPQGLVLLSGATEGVNTVFSSLQAHGHFKPGDEILITSHGYNACNNVAREVAQRTGAKIVEVQLPFPIEDAAQIRTLISAAVTDKTKLAMIDHISSIQAAIYPIADIVADMKAKGVPVLVDGAHALGQVPLNLTALDADFYTGNCHKWFCAPVGAGFLSIAPRWREVMRPLILSHGYNDPAPQPSRLLKMFGWTGTKDYSAQFVLRETSAFFDTLMPGGLESVRINNCALVREGAQIIEDELGWQRTVPDSMSGTMISFLMPPGDAALLKQRLRQELNMVTQIIVNGWNNQSVLRISAHAYNQRGDYEKLAAALKQQLPQI